MEWLQQKLDKRFPRDASFPREEYKKAWQSGIHSRRQLTLKRVELWRLARLEQRKGVRKISGNGSELLLVVERVLQLFPRRISSRRLSSGRSS